MRSRHGKSRRQVCRSSELLELRRWSGVIGLTKALAWEKETKGFTDNAIAPGYCDTPMVAGVPEKIRQHSIESVPMKRLCEPREIARCVFFLASEDAFFVTGATLSANGALYMF